MARHSPIANLSWAVADHQRIYEERPAATSGAFAGQSQCAARAQTGREFPFQGTSSLNIKCLIDGLVTDPHGCVLRKVYFHPLRNLLRAPSTGPAPTLPMNGPTSFPYHNRPIESDAIGCGDEAREPVLHIVAKGGITYQLAGLGALGCSIRMPLRCDGAIVEVASTCCGVTPNLP
jgi:hypothetical protein